MAKKKLKVGFVMGGGGALGSFSSGALEYVIKNLSLHLNTDIYSKCEVDVFSGASAGSASLAACVFELCKGNFPDKLLQRLWLDNKRGLDILTLLPEDFEKHNEPSLMSSKIMKEITDEVFVNVNLSNSSPLQNITGNEIRIGLSITNLNGIRHDISEQIIDPQYVNNDFSPLHDVVKSFWHGDRRLFKIKLNESDDLDITSDRDYRTFNFKSNKGWKEVGQTVQASGAFPLILPAVGLLRYKEEFGRFWPFGNENSHTCFYSDGGLIDNEPLKLAMNMAYDADINESDDFDRIFIVIDPIVGNDTQDIQVINTSFPEYINNSDFFKEIFSFGSKFLKLLFSEARYEDWHKVEKVNNRIKLTEDFIDQISDFVDALSSNDRIEILKSRLHQDLVKILNKDYSLKSLNQGHKTDQSHVEKMIKVRLESMLIKYKNSAEKLDESKKELFAYLSALLENISGVFNKQQIKVIGIAPESDYTTKGDFLSTLGGYLNNNWRKFDYQVGRYQAYKTLNSLSDELKLTSPNVEKVEKIENHNNPTYSDAPLEAREKFENYVLGITSKIMGYLKFWQRLKIGIGFIFFKKKVSREIVNILVQKINNSK